MKEVRFKFPFFFFFSLWFGMTQWHIIIEQCTIQVSYTFGKCHFSSSVFPGVCRYFFKVVYQIAQLFWVLFVKMKWPSHILVQVRATVGKTMKCSILALKEVPPEVLTGNYVKSLVNFQKIQSLTNLLLLLIVSFWFRQRVLLWW